MSFQNVREHLIYAWSDGLLSEEEFLFLYEELQSTNPLYPFWKYDPFYLDDLDSNKSNIYECNMHILALDAVA